MKSGSVSRVVALAAALLAPWIAVGWAAEAERLPVAALTIYPGETITEAMLTDKAFAAGTAETYPVIASPVEMVGKVARRTLLPGKLIARNAIGEAEIVVRGTIVRAILSNEALTMKTSVVALQAGGLGAIIQVRNIDSGKIITGVVQADGTVRVGGP